MRRANSRGRTERRIRTNRGVLKREEAVYLAQQDVVALEQELGGSGDADVHSAGHGVGKAIVALKEALALVEDVGVGLVAAVLFQSAHQLLRAYREC